MLRLLLLKCFLLFSFFSIAGTIKVKNIAELTAANQNARPGDLILLQNGEWKDAEIALNCKGTRENPIVFRAETAGKVLISGHSSLQLGGSYLVIDGWYFCNGYAGKDAVINFRIDKDQLADNCRVTNTVINDFNNPKRMDENYWVSFSGKNNRIDHCSFLNKKNMGVLVAVVLDDERSRENFHSIDHNYFGVRLPLASNSGEIIRVGVSQHALFNSNTQITDNFFEHCDGETEIVSIKSSNNVVRNNLFKECQGGVVLRHGNYNTVENNIFLGNDKEGTGGVRIINKGQWVVNNLFYRCRGTGFRSPLSLMNGVPNSPPIRYVEVSEAVIMNNSFIDCSPISFCEGSDAERTVVPHDVIFANNLFFNQRDKKIYNAYDAITKISFASNKINETFPQEPTEGFYKAPLTLKVNGYPEIIAPAEKTAWHNDSLWDLAKNRLQDQLSMAVGYKDKNKYNKVLHNAATATGSNWFVLPKQSPRAKVIIPCADAASVIAQLAKVNDKPVVLQLTGKDYLFTQHLLIKGNITLTSSDKKITIGNDASMQTLIELKGNGTLTIDRLNADFNTLQAASVISSDLSGTSNHSNFSMLHSRISNITQSFFTAAKSTLLDSIIVTNNSFSNISGTIFAMDKETDKKGYYNVEKIKFSNNDFTQNKGTLLNLLRSGTDESTMGPLLVFGNNKVTDCGGNELPLIKLYGVQLSFISGNKFINSCRDEVLIQYEDATRAAHSLKDNKIISSGKIITNKFVEQSNTITQ